MYSQNIIPKNHLFMVYQTPPDPKHHLGPVRSQLLYVSKLEAIGAVSRSPLESRWRYRGLFLPVLISDRSTF